MPAPIPTPIYHLTHIDNLARILQAGSLFCYRSLHQTSAAHTNIAHQHIQKRRDQRQVPCKPGGNLHDYIPFYFAPRSPMLYAIYKGNVEDIKDQRQIIYLVTTAQAVQQAGLPFVFTDGHAAMQFTAFYTDLVDLNQVDWQVMNALMWANTAEDGDRKRRRSAEFLVYQSCPFSLIQGIAVHNPEMVKRVREILQNSPHQPVLKLQGNWYY